MFAQGLPDFGMTENILFVVRIVASVGGAFVGWFLCDPLTRLLYRITMRSATPGWLLPWTKLSGALGVGLAIFFLVQFGGGGGGFGWGPGMGGGPGKGPGSGDGKSVASRDNAKDAKPGKDDKKTNEKVDTSNRKPVPIEIIGGRRFQDDDKFRYYVIDRADKAVSAADLEDYLKQNKDSIQVNIILTEESIGVDLAAGPLHQLRNLTSKYKIPVVEPRQ